MQTLRINLSEKRNFGDKFTTTFLFLKQEFKSLIAAFAVIVLPLVLVEVFLQSLLLEDTLAIAAGNVLDSDKASMGTLLINNLLVIIVFFWLQLFVLSYLRLYSDKYPLQEKIKISSREILRTMRQHLGEALGVGVVYMLAVIVGTILFIIPGIYVAVVLVFSAYFCVLRDKNVSSSLADAVDLCKGHWWSLFGYLLLFQLIITMLSYIFSLPYMGIAAISLVTEHTPGIFELSLVTLIAKIGGYLMTIILLAGIGVRFYSDLENKEHKSLLEKIGQIGSEEQTEKSEDQL